jgi:hypothetical protein
VPLQIPDVVAHATDAELAEISQIFSNLGGVQVELFGKRLRRNRADARVVQGVQAAQIDRQAIGRELGYLLGRLLGRGGPKSRFVRCFHKEFDCNKSPRAPRALPGW